MHLLVPFDINSFPLCDISVLAPDDNKRLTTATIDNRLENDVLLLNSVYYYRNIKIVNLKFLYSGHIITFVLQNNVQKLMKLTVILKQLMINPYLQEELL